jgi:NADPH-dependent 2,4-dienoyl-CoA reductase/sulfur reductase-like enzyme
MEHGIWQTDVVVLGTGGAALAAAVTAADSGLRVIVIERDRLIGERQRFPEELSGYPERAKPFQAGLRIP